MFVTKKGGEWFIHWGCRDVPDGASLCSLHGSKGAEGLRGKVVPGWHGQAPLVRADVEFVVENAIMLTSVK